MTGPYAPRAFWTRRGGLRYVAEHLPDGTDWERAVWLRAYWSDQAARGWARARVLFIASVVCGALALLLTLLRVLG